MIGLVLMVGWIGLNLAGVSAAVVKRDGWHGVRHFIKS